MGGFDFSAFYRVLTFQDYNTRVVLLGTAGLGIAAGLIGCFTLLRRRALMGDALAHATLPGIGVAFIVGNQFGGQGKSLVTLLLGAASSGLLGVAAIAYLRNAVRLREDAALGIVLSVFFGAGVALLSIIQQIPNGSAAGLEAFIYGKTASMISFDAWLIFGTAIFCIMASLLFFKEWKLLCFDEGFASSRGYPTMLLDAILMATVVLVTIVGLQAVGLVLMIALLIIPAVSARFWTDNLKWLMIVSATIGAMSCVGGSVLSAVFANFPSGPMIVLVAATMFAMSLCFGRRRGALIRALRRRQMKFKMDREHLLREMYEIMEENRGQFSQTAISFDQLLQERSWSPRRLRSSIRHASQCDLVVAQPNNELAFTPTGHSEAKRLAREHRLWELYLITHADIAPSRVDHEADRIEHVLEPELIAELECLLGDSSNVQEVPPSPHSAADSPSFDRR
jgi:manganese/zinc/iron transport system permease protein